MNRPFKIWTFPYKMTSKKYRIGMVLTHNGQIGLDHFICKHKFYFQVKTAMASQKFGYQMVIETPLFLTI